jgi:hypothetical protein
MKLYYVDTGAIHFFATLEEAKAAARVNADIHDQEVRVDRCVIEDNKPAIIALANGVTGPSDTVYIAKPKKRAA